MISVIMPVYHEEAIIEKYLANFPYQDNLEVLVIDGGSQDRTVALAQKFPVKVELSPEKGRARQMNFGASQAQGNILLFLHLDCQLPPNFIPEIEQILQDPQTIAGAFRFQVDAPHRSFRWLEKLVNWRSQFLGLPYGDQGLFIYREKFQAIGGFQNLPIMEDYEWVQRLKKHGKLSIAPSAIITSGRRWQKLGLWKTTWINQMIILGYYLKISPDKLARWYRHF